MRRVFSLIEKAGQVEIPVLLVGETGTGKELVATEIHKRSPRNEGPFVAVNMGALTRELSASELFGHTKGAFTGAIEFKDGRFAEAHKGTIFLDEIAAMDESVQVSLLRVLESRSYRKVGGKHDIPTDVRVISATNSEPDEIPFKSTFRQDLLQRLQVFTIQLPALRSRADDIELLATVFMKVYLREFQTRLKGITPKALESLRNYPWPGNVRELKNVIAQAIVIADEGYIDEEHLPPRIRNSRTSYSGQAESNGEPPDDCRQFEMDMCSEPTRIEPIYQSRGNGILMPLGFSLEQVEKAYVLKTMTACGNNKSLTAKTLRISRKTLYDKLLRWGVRG